MNIETMNNLISWYNINKRDFPWRKTDDPYKIWISEIMLQQTTTGAVLPYYNRFIQRYPTVKELADSSLDEVYKYWEGLGYYRRAKHLYLSAKYILEHYNGIFPDDYNDIINLKGIGPYTAGAICSIAFNKPIAAVDGNVLRIMSRVLESKKNIALLSTQKELKIYIEQLLYNTNPSLFNQSLMDLGASICKVKNPKCSVCPINSDCKAYRNNTQNILPVNIKKLNRKYKNYITGIIRYKDQYMMIRNKDGLLENLYGLVQYEAESPYTFIEQFEKDYHIQLTAISYIDNIKHVFTHITWSMSVYEFIISDECEYLYTYEELKNLAVSTAHNKAIKAYLKSKEL